MLTVIDRKTMTSINYPEWVIFTIIEVGEESFLALVTKPNASAKCLHEIV